MNTIGYAIHAADTPFAPFAFDRRELRLNDVAIEVLYCGICHTDLHMARNDWGGTIYPFVPGHEFVGRVVAIDGKVSRHAVGDTVAVGCMIDSCQRCDQCRRGEEQFCREGITNTYNDKDRIDGSWTYGGYSKHIVVREEFVLKVPATLDIARVAPLLCAGVTSYSPLRTWNVGPGSRVGVIGLGGLGHMAVKLAAAMGADVTVLSRSDAKEADAIALGADRLLVSTDEQAMAAAASSLDLIVDTVPAKHDLNPYLPLLDVDGTLVVVGQVGPLAEPSTVPLLFGRRRIAGSVIGGIAETQEMLDFCAEAGVLSDCEMVAIEDLDAAFERLARSDVRYRFVIDMASMDHPQT